MNRVRLIAVVLLGAAILVSCIPSENRDFSIYLLTENNAYQMKIRGAKHASFGDPCLWGGLFKILGDQATIDGERMAKIQNVYTLAFFDTHLRNLASPLLDGPSSDYPEVAFRSHHP